MILKRIDCNDKFYKPAYELYQNSFPYLERRDENGHNWVMKKCDYNFTIIEENGEFLGIMLYFESDDFIFLEHFAVLPTIRGKGIGARALELLKNKGKTVILEIEYPEDEITTRRCNFYKRNGFKLTNHYHIQAKYHSGDDDLPLKILSYPHEITTKEYAVFKNYLKTEVTL